MNRNPGRPHCFALVLVLTVLSAADGDAGAADLLPKIVGDVPKTTTTGSLYGFVEQRYFEQLHPKREKRRRNFIKSRADLRKAYRGLIDAYARHGKRYGVRWDFAVFQMMHETDSLRFTGRTPVENHNYAGIGVTADPGQWRVSGDRFENADKGALAHIQHLAAYADRFAKHRPAVEKRIAELTASRPGNASLEMQLVKAGVSQSVLQSLKKKLRPADYGRLLVKRAAAVEVGGKLGLIAPRTRFTWYHDVKPVERFDELAGRWAADKDYTLKLQQYAKDYSEFLRPQRRDRRGGVKRAGRLQPVQPQQFVAVQAADDDDEPLTYRIDRHVPTRMFDGKRCWCHPRAGVVPGAGKDGKPRVVMTLNTLHVSGSDVFKAMHTLETSDLGGNWTKPRESETLAVRYETIDGQRRPVAVSDFWPTWHAKSKTLLGVGHTVAYTADWKVRHPRPRHVSYSTYNPKTSRWSTWRKMELPGEKFHDAGAGCVQRYDLEDGKILLPFYFRPPGKNSRVAVALCTFDGETLKYEKHGTELHVNDKTRGLHEPSLTRFGGDYLLTIRNDKRSFVTRSRDGLNYEPIREWKFDDGKPLGSYNTQTHWVTHSDGLFLVYTRRGAENDHVFRHRAPLFIAQVDPKSLRVLRKTERVLVPERGARLGNFGVTQVSENETWVTVAEWMQTWGPQRILPVKNKYGSDGSVFVAMILWSKPNRAQQPE